MTTARQALTNGNPNSVPGLLQEIDAGRALSAIAQLVQAPVVANVLALPELEKAAVILAAYGWGTTSGPKTPLAPFSNAATATTECSINGAGDIVFFGTDAITEAWVMYIPYQGLKVFEEQITVTAHFGALLSGRKAQVLLSAASLAGTLTGNLTPIKRQAAAPATTQAAIGGTATNGSDKIAFAVADAVTSARVRYLAVPGFGTDTDDTLSQALGADTQLT